MPIENGAVQDRPPQQPALDTIGSRLVSHKQAVVFIREQLNGVLGRAFGEQPAPAVTAKPKAVRSGAVGAIDECLDDISDITSDISNMLARLETLA